MYSSRQQRLNPHTFFAFHSTANEIEVIFFLFLPTMQFLLLIMLHEPFPSLLKNLIAYEKHSVGFVAFINLFIQ